ncbi:MAG: hypothetical protein Q9226_005680 [Calogaya cf. arnoldii]
MGRGLRLVAGLKQVSPVLSFGDLDFWCSVSQLLEDILDEIHRQHHPGFNGFRQYCSGTLRPTASVFLKSEATTSIWNFTYSSEVPAQSKQDKAGKH